MSTIANITWGFVPGSLSTLVEYKISSSSIWITPSSPTNPTTGNTYPITILDNVLYDVRLTTNGSTCTPFSRTLQIVNSLGCCPSGYTLSSDGTFCFKVNTTAATPPSGSQNAVTVSGPNNFYYGIFGSLIFDPGYNINGTGTFTQISYSNSFWVNGVGYPSFPSASNTSGPLNRAGIWSPTVLNPQTVGFSICVNLPSNGRYYIGISCDDFGQINVDGATIILQDRTALKAYLQAHGYPYPIGLDPNQVTFNFWYIYPVDLTSGNHIIEIIGNNTSGTVPGAADLGCEIYNLTPSQIQSATSYVSMGAGLVFSSKDFVGQPIQIGSGGIGYTCPPGYSLVLCSGPAFCTQTLTTPPILCGTTTTSTTTSTTSTTSTTTSTTSTTSTSTTSTTTHTTTTTSTTTTTTTHTTTTTSSTTTTTTTSLPLIVGNNNSTGSQVTGLTVNGTSPTGMVFPINPMSTSSGTHAASASATVVVTLSGPAGSILIVDSSSNIQCQNYIGDGPYTFTGIVVNNTHSVFVGVSNSGDLCS